MRRIKHVVKAQIKKDGAAAWREGWVDDASGPKL